MPTRSTAPAVYLSFDDCTWYGAHALRMANMFFGRIATYNCCHTLSIGTESRLPFSKHSPKFDESPIITVCAWDNVEIFSCTSKYREGFMGVPE
jgi:hypothetical protein